MDKYQKEAIKYKELYNRELHLSVKFEKQRNSNLWFGFVLGVLCEALIYFALS